MSNKLQVILTSRLKDPLSNGGYSHVGDGNMEANMYLTKEGISLKLNTEDIKTLMVNLKSINPSICIT
jgi:hypothetical protein